jgi:uncharacterized membrane protein
MLGAFSDRAIILAARQVFLDKSKSSDSKSDNSSVARLEPNEWKPLARFWHLHARLFLSAAFGIAVTLAALALPWRISTRLLVGWDSGVALYLVLIYQATANASIASMRRRAAINDEGALALLVLATAAALISLAAVVAELGRGPGHGPGPYQIALGIGTILLSWAFMHLIFALHYAHAFYGASQSKRAGGLFFPGNEDPDYWDFFYYALVVAMTAQVSDVQVTTKTIRRLTMVHGVISFFFNVTVLALTINIVSSLMSN